MDTIPFTVVGGYLGAGKTTLLNHLLRHNAGRSIALLLNDFGSINIDADLIESAVGGQVNLVNGCICCSLSDGFEQALEDLRNVEPRPEAIVVEASGVADVGRLAQYGRRPGMNLEGIIVVADAESVRAKVVDKYVGPTVSRQLECADLIVLNKVDLVSREECGELMTWLSGIGDARIVHATRSRVPLEVLLGQHVPAEGRRPDWRDGSVPHDHFEQYVSWSFTTDKVFTSSAARLFAESLPAAVIRAKGFIRVEGGALLVLSVVGNRVSLQPSNTALRSTRLIAIGLKDQLVLQSLDDLVASCLFGGEV